MLLIMDNLAGHKTQAFVLWVWQHGILPLYTPLGASWLNRGQSIQRLLKRRPLDGQTPTTPDDIMQWFQDTAVAWNTDPTPFEWNAKRQRRRQRSASSRYFLGGSGPYSHRPLVRRPQSRNGDAHSN